MVLLEFELSCRSYFLGCGRKYLITIHKLKQIYIFFAICCLLKTLSKPSSPATIDKCLDATGGGRETSRGLSTPIFSSCSNAGPSVSVLEFEMVVLSLPDLSPRRRVNCNPSRPDVLRQFWPSSSLYYPPTPSLFPSNHPPHGYPFLYD
jgi:hypothetical protein